MIQVPRYSDIFTPVLMLINRRIKNMFVNKIGYNEGFLQQCWLQLTYFSFFSSNIAFARWYLRTQQLVKCYIFMWFHFQSNLCGVCLYRLAICRRSQSMGMFLKSNWKIVNCNILFKYTRRIIFGSVSTCATTSIQII